VEGRPQRVGGIMPRSSERRHRLQGNEILPVKEAVYRDLVRRIESRDDLLLTAWLFKAWFRMETHCTHKPAYPGHSTWEELEASLGFGTVSPSTESLDYGTLTPQIETTKNGTDTPLAESSLDMAVKMSIRMSKEDLL
jgi:hypothetical protein